MSSGRESGPLARIPFKWRLAGGVSVLTLLILLAFALAAGLILTDRARSDFDRETAVASEQLANEIKVSLEDGQYSLDGVRLGDYVASQHARVVILDQAGDRIASTPGAPSFGILDPGASERDGYLIETRNVPLSPSGSVLLQYARPLASLEETSARVWIVLAIGVLVGSLLSLVAGLWVARRAMRPISALTATAGRIAQTGDPGLSVPIPPARDEIRDLATTLANALEQLAASQTATERALERQREFVADASHELRTPLTALMANLEMLESELDGDPREDAASALAAARRMRDLIADLLMLARDGSGEPRSELVALDDLVRSVVAEVQQGRSSEPPMLELDRATVVGDRQSLFRVVRNLIDNAHMHASGAQLLISTVTVDGNAMLRVDDGGPGVPPAQESRIFDRFVRGGGESSSGTGLGLAIVKAIVEECGGTISVGRSDLGGARFEILIPSTQASTRTATTTGLRRS